MLVQTRRFYGVLPQSWFVGGITLIGRGIEETRPFFSSKVLPLERGCISQVRLHRLQYGITEERRRGAVLCYVTGLIYIYLAKQKQVS